jgi:3-hydroxybutyryl-CoA dehydratase
MATAAPRRQRLIYPQAAPKKPANAKPAEPNARHCTRTPTPMTTGTYFEDLRIGQTASLGKTITEADILLYAAVSLDTNPVHLNAEAASKSVFGERIAHGMLSAGLISAVLGTQLPGPGTLYMRQSLRFAAPVKIGATVTATVEVTALNAEKHRATLKTTCTVGDEVVIEGEAYVQVPSRG